MFSAGIGSFCGVLVGAGAGLSVFGASFSPTRDCDKDSSGTSSTGSDSVLATCSGSGADSDHSPQVRSAACRIEETTTPVFMGLAARLRRSRLDR